MQSRCNKIGATLSDKAPLRDTLAKARHKQDNSQELEQLHLVSDNCVWFKHRFSSPNIVKIYLHIFVMQLN